MSILQNLDFKTAFTGLMSSLVGGIGVVLEVLVTAYILALILGLLIAIGRNSKHKILKGILSIIVEVIRGTPLLVQLVYIYYVVPLLITLVLQLFGGGKEYFQIPAFVAGCIGMGLNYGCYLSEVIRSAIIEIDRGQTEAALALGYTDRQALFKIVLPQAMKASIPVFGNYLVTMVKDTSLLAYITVNELLLRTQAYVSQTFYTIESYTYLALIYLIISLPLAKVFGLVERRLKR